MSPASHDRAPAAASAHRSYRLALPRDRRLELSTHAPAVMGVLNVTPDSFSDGGRWLRPEAAVEHALALLDEGADLLDVGAESTRPGGGVYGAGARELSASEELDRLLPVLETLRPLTEAPISVDTRKGAVASAALAAGADLINDVGALRDDSMPEAVAGAGCPIVVMHSRGELASMQIDTHYDDLRRDVRDALAQTVERAVAAGIDRRQVIVDPGIGFGKSALQSLELLRGTADLQKLGCPILVGASRKSFIAHVTAAPVEARLPGSLAAAAWATLGGAAILRVHDVAATRQFLAVWQAIAKAGRAAAAAPSPGSSAGDRR